MKSVAARFRRKWMEEEFAGIRVARDNQPPNALEIEF
jgi:hypothetical protein